MSKITLFFAALAAGEVSAAAASIPTSEVFDDTRASMICVAGSVIGAFLTVALFPPKGEAECNRSRNLALKFGASMLGGFAFSPALMGWCSIDKTVDNLMCVSAFTAVFAVTALNLAAPRVEEFIAKRKLP